MSEEKKKVRAKFPAIGSINNKRFFDAPPVRAEGEDEDLYAYRVRSYEALKDASLDVELVDRGTVIEWSHKFDLWWATEEKRKLDLEKSGQVVPRGYTREGAAEIRALHREVVERCVSRVRMIDFGDTPSEEITDRKKIAQHLDAATLLADASRLAREAQRPTPAQSEC